MVALPQRSMSVTVLACNCPSLYKQFIDNINAKEWDDRWEKQYALLVGPQGWRTCFQALTRCEHFAGVAPNGEILCGWPDRVDGP